MKVLMQHQNVKKEGFVVDRDNYNKNCSNACDIELQHWA
jgi:hypothetical protein